MDRSGYTQEWVDRYTASHQHPLNRALHAVGIPMIAIAVPLGLASLAIAGLRLPALGLFVSGWVLQFIGTGGRKAAGLPGDWRFLVTGRTLGEEAARWIRR
jgi:uncharacterized membrane protein YGL010W